MVAVSCWASCRGPCVRRGRRGLGAGRAELVDTADGPLSVPNSALLAAGIGPQRDPAAAQLDLSEHIGAQRHSSLLATDVQDTG